MLIKTYKLPEKPGNNSDVGILRRDQMVTDITLVLNNYRVSTNKLRNRLFKFAGFAAILAACFFQMSCGNVDSTSTKVSVYKYAGSVQCYGGGTPISAMQSQLVHSRIQVHTASCGVDGNVYAAVCGTSDGIIGVFEVPSVQQQAATSLGFMPLSNLPAATITPCQ